MASKWFVQKEDYVEGPISSEDVQSRLQAGQLTPQHLIWGKGLSGWQTVSWWLGELANLAAGGDLDTAPEMWHYAVAGKSHGPYNKSSLVNELKNAPALGDVMVWTKGMKEWAPLFEFHDLLTAVGVNKRQFPRADLSGKATIRIGETVLVANLLSVSEGGCGVALDTGLVAGQTFSIELASGAFREPLHAKGECRYVSEGVAGLKFTFVSPEAKGAIVQYVRAQTQTRFVLRAA